MRTKRITKCLYVVCLSVPVILGTAATARSQTPSILDRALQVEDPELGDLIRMSMENRQGGRKIGNAEASDIVRKVTQSYSQMKLLEGVK